MNDFDKQIAEIYREMELQLIQSMQRNLGRHLAEETKTGLKYPQWQAVKLKELKRYQRQNKQIINSCTKGLPAKIAANMKLELTQGSIHELKRYRKALGAGYKPARVMKDSFFKVNDRKVTAMVTALQHDMHTANTAVLRMMNDTYRQTIFKSGMFVSNGVMTEKQAYDMAVKDFLSRGINCITYKDGRRVNIADYTSMAVRTANQRAYMVGEGEFRKEIDETLVIISKHNTACALCQPFETKVLIDDVYSGGKAEDGDYMLLSEAMGLGLFHPRCRHGLGTYYPELEEINHYDNENNRVNEYGSDKVNSAHIANMIQKYTRLAAGSVDPENVARYQERLRFWEDKKQIIELQKNQESDIISLQRFLGENEFGYTLPNSINAATTQNKLQGYLLNSNHPRGKDKARVLNSVLGYNYSNWNELSDKIFNAVQTAKVSKTTVTEYGTKYVVPIKINGKKGKSIVLNTAWQIDKGSNIPRFITATFNKKTISKI